MRERAVKIGKPTPLVGIVTEPKEFDPDQPAVIILNSGVMHHIGTCRLSVKIARSLAENGIMSCRFDFSGIGDSEPRRGGLAFEESAPIEVKEVMDFLAAKRGVTKFVLYGLCSGADAAYETAKVEDRIIGIAQIDAYCWRTWKYYIVHYGPRMLKLDVWKRFFKRKMSKKPKIQDSVDEEFVELPSYIREYPPLATVRSGLKQIIDRNVHVYSIFTGGQMHTLNYKGQFEDSMKGLGFADRLKVDYILDASHIIVEPQYQRSVVQRLSDWVVNLNQNRIATS